MALEIISWPIPMKECCQSVGSNPTNLRIPGDLLRHIWPSRASQSLFHKKSSNPPDYPEPSHLIKIFHMYRSTLKNIFVAPYPTLSKREGLVGKNLFFSSKKVFNLMNSKIWERATGQQNQQNDLCAQRRLKSGWASASSDQSLRCQHEETLGP